MGFIILFFDKNYFKLHIVIYHIEIVRTHEQNAKKDQSEVLEKLIIAIK